VAGPLSIERTGRVALVTLQRPEKRNALSIELREELARAFTSLAGDDEVACAVLTGAGSAFCAGMDFTQFGGDRANRERLVESSLDAVGAGGGVSTPGGGGGAAWLAAGLPFQLTGGQRVAAWTRSAR